MSREIGERCDGGDAAKGSQQKRMDVGEPWACSAKPPRSCEPLRPVAMDIGDELGATKQGVQNLEAGGIPRVFVGLFGRTHHDAGSFASGLRLRFDLLRAIFSGDVDHLSRGWDETYVQVSDHHDASVEIIRARGVPNQPNSDFCMIGVPVDVFLGYRHTLDVLLRKFAPPQATQLPESE